MPQPIPTTVLSRLVDTATISKRVEESWGIPKSTYASTLNKCMRQQWYARVGQPEVSAGEPRADWMRNATAGNLLHDSYQGLLIRSGSVATTKDVLKHTGWKLKDFTQRVQDKGLPELAIELPLPINKYNIGGKGDAICRITEDIPVVVNGEETVLHFDNDLVVVEIKTMKDKYFKSLPNNFKWEDYYSQIQIYMHFFKIKWTIVFAINRNDDDMKEFLVPYDADYAQTRLRRALELKEHLESDTVPQAEPAFMACRLCPYTDACDLQDLLDGVQKPHWSETEIDDTTPQDFWPTA